MIRWIQWKLGLRPKYGSPEAREAVRSAAKKLGVDERHIAAVNILEVPGRYATDEGWLAVEKDGKYVQGWCEAVGKHYTLCVVTTLGRFQMKVAEHEAAHAILFSRGFHTEQQHHNIMRGRGFYMGAA